MKYPLLFSLSLFAAACGEDKPAGAPPKSTRATTAQTTQALTSTTPAPDTTRSNATSYKEIRGGGIDEIPVSLCDLLRFYGAGAGAYRVKSITGYTEELLDFPGDFDGFTYVELELVADWSGASPANPVVRITGGPTTASITMLWTISLKVGEVVGLLIEPASPRNRGFPGIDPLGLFQEKPEGGYSNGQLFTKQRAALDTIGHSIQNLVNLGPACASQDVLPELGGSLPGAPPPAAAPGATATAGPTSPPADGGTR